MTTKWLSGVRRPINAQMLTLDDLLKIDDWSLPRCTSTKAKEVGSARGTRRRDKMAKDATLLSGSLRTGALFGKTATPTNLTLQNLNTESPEVQLKPMPPTHTPRTLQRPC